MTTNQMRSALVQAYPGPKWKLKVSEMEDRQVFAVYKNMQRRGNLKKHKWKDSIFMEPLPKQTEKYEQLTIWDFM